MTDIDRVLAARNAIIQRNAAIRNATAPATIDPKAAEAFAAKLQGALSATATSVPALTVNQPSPTDSVRSAIASVNETMEQEDVATEAYERGETTDIAAVMLMKSRSDIEFEATLQIRNKLLAAYKDIMTMQI